MTTNFTQQSARHHHANIHEPGVRSPKSMKEIPGPGTYQFKNLSIGVGAPSAIIKSRPSNLQGEHSIPN